MIDPCIPRSWDGFKVIREFRGAVYHITVENPDHVCRGVKSVRVDGKDIANNVIPILSSGTYPVRIVMGKVA
jgi:cellobiose phosphorylase